MMQRSIDVINKSSDDARKLANFGDIHHCSSKLEKSWMDSTLESPPELSNTSNVLLIPVECLNNGVMDGNSTIDPTRALTISGPNYMDFDQHVSPLDPNMGSVAPYSPYEVSAAEFDAQLIISNQQQHADDNEHVIETTHATQPTTNSGVQFLPIDMPEVSTVVQDIEQPPVEYLIMDPNTGISYSVNAQEYLQDDQQLLSTLGPETLLDGDLLHLDVNALKSEIVIENDAVDDAIPSRDENVHLDIIVNEVDLYSCVKVIADKPVLSRARATLPESHLVLNNIGDNEYGIFARKFIPRLSQFGPVEGVVVHEDLLNSDHAYDISVQDDKGKLHYIDISNEENSNWMKFVRRATSFDDQNCLLVQIGNVLYFKTSRDILAKEELKMGFSASYARRRHLPYFERKNLEDLWYCLECSQFFEDCLSLQTHMKEKHFPITLENPSTTENTSQLQESLLAQCVMCATSFAYNMKGLQKHLLDHLYTSHRFDFPDKCLHLYKMYFRDGRKLKRKRKLYPCSLCTKSYGTAEQLQIHIAVHSSESAKPLQCSNCNKRFKNKSALLCHQKVHVKGSKVFHCPLCIESFASVNALKNHVVQHADSSGLYTCPHCKKSFQKYCVIRKHIRAFHSERKYSCTLCPMRFPSQYKLRLHMLRHSDFREFQCSECGKQFKRKDKLVEHTRVAHGLNEQKKVVKKKVQRKKPKPKKSESTATASTESSKPDEKEATNVTAQRVIPSDFERFPYKCHTCLLGFKRRGMLVNHLAKRHPDIPTTAVPELNLPIVREEKEYYCSHCDKVYKSSSKRKAHMLKNHPGVPIPVNNNKSVASSSTDVVFDAWFTQTIGRIKTEPQSCAWCHKQYASKAKLLQHQRSKHSTEVNGGLLESGEAQEHGENLMEQIIYISPNDIQLNQMEAAQTELAVFTEVLNSVQNKRKLEETVTKDNLIDREFLQFPLTESQQGTGSQKIIIESDLRFYKLLADGDNLVSPR